MHYKYSGLFFVINSEVASIDAECGRSLRKVQRALAIAQYLAQASLSFLLDHARIIEWDSHAASSGKLLASSRNESFHMLAGFPLT